MVGSKLPTLRETGDEPAAYHGGSERDAGFLF